MPYSIAIVLLFMTAFAFLNVAVANAHLIGYLYALRQWPQPERKMREAITWLLMSITLIIMGGLVLVAQLLCTYLRFK